MRYNGGVFIIFLARDMHMMASLVPNLFKNATRSVMFSSVAFSAAAVCAALPSTAQAATSTYYNCAGNDGCKPVTVWSWRTTSYSKTKYPLVMAHGMGGWTKMAGMVDYYYGIITDLAKNGTTAYATQVPSFNATLVRSEALLKEVEEILAVSGAKKVNLLGHSHGAPDVRYTMHHLPERIASVTTVGGVNHGSKTADDIVALEKDDNKKWVPEALYGFFSYFVGPIISTLTGEPKLPQQAKQQIQDLTTAGNAKFNKTYAAGLPEQYCNASTAATQWQDVKMYSFSGASVFTNAFDVSDYLLLATAKSFEGEASDGLVSTCSSHFGRVVRDDYRINHLDEMNHFFGLVNWFEASPVAIYRKHVNMLKNAGL